MSAYGDQAIGVETGDLLTKPILLSSADRGDDHDPLPLLNGLTATSWGLSQREVQIDEGGQIPKSNIIIRAWSSQVSPVLEAAASSTLATGLSGSRQRKRARDRMMRCAALAPTRVRKRVSAKTRTCPPVPRTDCGASPVRPGPHHSAQHLVFSDPRPNQRQSLPGPHPRTWRRLQSGAIFEAKPSHLRSLFTSENHCFPTQTLLFSQI